MQSQELPWRDADLRWSPSRKPDEDSGQSEMSHAGES
jgi:hypothetical protein